MISSEFCWPMANRGWVRPQPFRFGDIVAPNTRMTAIVDGMEYSALATNDGMEIYEFPRRSKFYEYPPTKEEVSVRIGKLSCRFNAYQTGFEVSLSRVFPRLLI